MIIFETTIEQDLSVLRTLLDCHNSISVEETRRIIRESICKISESLACRVCYITDTELNKNESD